MLMLSVLHLGGVLNTGTPLFCEHKPKLLPYPPPHSLNPNRKTLISRKERRERKDLTQSTNAGAKGAQLKRAKYAEVVPKAKPYNKQTLRSPS